MIILERQIKYFGSSQTKYQITSYRGRKIVLLLPSPQKPSTHKSSGIKPTKFSRTERET